MLYVWFSAYPAPVMYTASPEEKSFFLLPVPSQLSTVGARAIQFQVMVEFSVMENVTEVSLPVYGTDPEPDQPEHVQTVPFSFTGLVTVQVTEAPPL